MAQRFMLQDRRAFDRVFKLNTRRACTQQSLLLLAPTTAGCSRLGLVLAKKKVKSAVKRNFIKRRVKEKFKHYLTINQESFYCVYLVRSAKICALDSRALNQHLDELFNQALR